MPKPITIYVYFAVLICGHQSDSSSSSISLEDTSHTHDRIGLLIPGIGQFSEEKKKHKFERSPQFNTTNRDPDIYRDVFNLHVEKINQSKSKLNYERDDFPNTPKLHKNALKPKVHPRAASATTLGKVKKVKKSSKRDSTVTVSRKVKKQYKRNSPSVTEKTHRVTQASSEFEPDTPEMDHTLIKSRQDESDELDSSNAKFISKMKEQKLSYTKHHKKSNISLNNRLKMHKDKRNILEKRKVLRNQSIPKNKLKLLKTTINKKYNIVRHIQPESDIDRHPTKVVRNERHYKRKKINNFLHSSEPPSDYASPQIMSPNKPALTKHDPRKDEFTLTISDIDENSSNLKSNRVHYNPLEDSPLLDTDPTYYQDQDKQRPHRPNIKLSAPQILRQNKHDNFESISKDPMPVKQQPIEVGLIDGNENKQDNLDDKLNDKLDNFFKSIQSQQKDEHIFPAEKNSSKPENKYTDKYNPFKGILDSPHSQTPEVDVNLDNEHKFNLGKFGNPQIIKKNFDTSVKMSEKLDKPVTKEEGVLDDDFSKAEILLTESSDSDKSDYELDNTGHMAEYEVIKNALREAGRRVHSKKRWLSCFGKKAFKKCRKACRGAYTSVCRRLKCSHKAKRDLKYQCNKSCKRTFGTSKYSVEE